MERCKHYISTQIYSEKNGAVGCKVCGSSHNYMNMKKSEAENVTKTFCEGDFTKCNYYKKHQEENKMALEDLDLKEKATETEVDENQMDFGDLSELKIEEALEEMKTEQALEETAITAKTTNGISESHMKALKCHSEIVSNCEIAQSALLNICKNLKTIRDEELYKELGFNSFGEYVENNGDYEFKERQAYNYISTYEQLGAKVIEENAQAGITKLNLLVQIPAYERAEVLENNDLANISVSELKKLKDELVEKGEQISFLENQTADNEKETNAIQDELKKLQDRTQQLLEEKLELKRELEKQKTKELEQNEQKTELSAEETEKIKQEAEQKAKADYERKLKAEIDKVKSDTKQALEVEYKEKIKKVSSSSADESKIAFKFYFNEMKKNLEAFKQTIESVEDAELKVKYKEAYKQYLNLLIAEI